MLITKDVFDIADRLKEIDPCYELHYEPRDGKFRLRSSHGETLLVFPYDRADERMIRHALRTRVERLKSIVEEIERANEAARERYFRARENEAEDGLKEAAEKYYADAKRQGFG